MRTKRRNPVGRRAGDGDRLGFRKALFALLKPERGRIAGNGALYEHDPAVFQVTNAFTFSRIRGYLYTSYREMLMFRLARQDE